MKGYASLPGALFFLCFFTLAPGSTASAGTRFSLGTGFDYTTGDYGAGIAADSYSTALLLGYHPTVGLDFTLTIPYFYQSSGATITAGGIRFRTDGSGGMTGPGMGPRGRGGDPEAAPSEPAASRSGLGDLMLTAGYRLLPETAGRPQLRATGFIKFPTADEKQRLGTGEYDYGVGLVLSKWLDSWYLFGRGEAVFQGDDGGLGLRDFQIYEAGGGYQIGDKLLPTLSIWGASRPTDGSPAQLEARVKLSYQLSGSSGISGYGLKGLTDSSPDYGAGGSLYFNF